MPLVLYDTRARRKVPFEPLEPGRVTMYVCGPTVYDHPHLGHARSAVAFDVIRRSLAALGYRVTFVRNITDVDDKIIGRAREEGRSPWEVAEEYARSYESQMARIGVLPPTISPRATGHITDMLALVQRLVDAGIAYPVEGGDVYFSVRSFDGYGALSSRTLEDVRAGERVEPDPRKRDPLDFALWKGAKPGEPSWPSPWGPGRPGWHVECSAMATKYLGETFDIHGGGEDLIFPHHENEIAQSVAATGAGFARYWLHNGFITVNQEKMSKSLRNFMLLSEVLSVQPPPAVRALLAGLHYRSPLEMSEEPLAEARAVWDRFATFARNAREVAGGDAEPDESWRAQFLAALSDDFNAPAAIAVLHELLNEANPLVEAGEGGKLAPLYGAFRACAAVLGLDPVADWPEERRRAQVAPLVEYLLELRQEARAAKDFRHADAVREALNRAGVLVEDRPGGARWYLADPWAAS